MFNFNNITDLRTPNSGRMTAHESSHTIIISEKTKIDSSEYFGVFLITEEPIVEYYNDFRTSAPHDYLKEWWEYAHEYD